MKPVDRLARIGLLLVVPSGAIGCATAPAAPPSMRCEIVGYGTIDRAPADRLLVPLAPVGSAKLGKTGSPMRILSPGPLVTARPGSGFGVAHRFPGARASDAVTVVLTHPPIDYGEGPLTRTSWTKSATGHGTSFFFDLEAELVAGVWTFSFFDADVELCRQAFVVSRPGGAGPSPSVR